MEHILKCLWNFILNVAVSLVMGIVLWTAFIAVYSLLKKIFHWED